MKRKGRLAARPAPSVSKRLPNGVRFYISINHSLYAADSEANARLERYLQEYEKRMNL